MKNISQIREEFCKWYCSKRKETVQSFCTEDFNCEDCVNIELCLNGDGHFVLCELCTVDEFIRFVDWS